MTDYSMLRPSEHKNMFTCYRCNGRINYTDYEKRIENGKLKRYYIDGKFVTFHNTCFELFKKENPSLIYNEYKTDLDVKEIKPNVCYECNRVIAKIKDRTEARDGAKIFHLKCFKEYVSKNIETWEDLKDGSYELY